MAWIYVGPGGKRWANEGETSLVKEERNGEGQDLKGGDSRGNARPLVNYHPFLGGDKKSILLSSRN